MSPPKRVEIAPPGGIQDRPRDHEKEALEEHVVQRMDQPCGQRQRRQCGHAVGPEGQRQTEGRENDADVLDRGIGQHPLAVAVHIGKENTHHRRHRAYHDHRGAHPPGDRAEEVEGDAHEAVDRDFGHHTAHKRRDMTRCGRMRHRQPDMERNQARLRSRADHHHGQNQSRQSRRARDLADRRKIIPPIRPRHQTESQQQNHRPEARHHQIEIACVAGFAFAVMGHHQRPGQKRHHFP